MLVGRSPHHLHMPFVFRMDDHIHVAYCRSFPQYRRRRGKLVQHRHSAWKLHWAITTVPAMGTIETGLRADEDECSPCVSGVPGQIQLSFIGTLNSEQPRAKTLDGRTHRLFTMRGTALDQLGLPAEVSNDECYCGFSRPDLTVMSDGLNPIRIEGTSSNRLFTSFQQLYRISYCSHRPMWLLITGALDSPSEAETLVFDLETDRALGVLRVEGQPTYKPSLIPGLAAVTRPPLCKQGWRICYSNDYAILPSPITAAIRR